jgi:hypothetical protein
MTGPYFKNRNEIVDQEGKTLWKRHPQGTEVVFDKDGNEITIKVGTKGRTFQQVGAVKLKEKI